jgi:hypothetical protein
LALLRDRHSGTSAGLALCGSLACGPFILAFVIGVVAGYELYKRDRYFHLTDKVSALYNVGLAKLAQVWSHLGEEADARSAQLGLSVRPKRMRVFRIGYGRGLEPVDSNAIR